MVSRAARLARDLRLETETLALGGREVAEEAELEAEAGVGGVAAKREGQLGSEEAKRVALRVAGDDPTKLGRLSSSPVEGRIEPQAFKVAIALASERRIVCSAGRASAKRREQRKQQHAHLYLILIHSAPTSSHLPLLPRHQFPLPRLGALERGPQASILALELEVGALEG